MITEHLELPPLAAGVHVRPDDALPIAIQDHGLFPHVGEHEIARLSNLADVAEEEPADTT